ncbi:MAG TPA: hypothetical protein VMB49_03480 [Acidobacteriaceae bacterium]|nr:hypothetical protein [Acidobacteriaceae bacterium]
MRALKMALAGAGAWKCWLVIVMLLLCEGFAFAQCASLAVIVNPKSSIDSLSSTQLRRLILGDVRSWPDQKPVAIVSLDPSSPIEQCVMSKVVRLSDAEYRRYLMSAEFRGEEPLVIHPATSDQMAAKMVAGAVTAFAVIDASSLPALAGSIKILHINGKLPGEAGYPL